MSALSDRLRRAVLPAATALVATVFYVVASRFLIDDTFITLSYARNLAFHGEWALVHGMPSNTATSPLGVLSLAAGTFLTRDAVIACGVVFVLSCVAIVAAFRRIAEHQGFSTAFAPVALAAVVANPVVSSSIGLEVVLGTALLAWVAVFASEHAPIALGVAAGAAVLARLDLVIVVVALVLIRRSPLDRLWTSVLAAAATALPWFVVSWLFLGSAVPDTVVIKTDQSAWGQWGFGNGLGVYFEPYPVATVLVAVLPLLGVLCLVLRFRVNAVCAWGVGGLVYYVAYTLLEVPPYHWYYGVSAVAGTVVFVGTVFAAGARVRAVGVTVAGAVTVSAAALWIWTVATDRVVPITSNHATAEQYESMGRQISSYIGGGALRPAGEIGALSYYCDCVLIDRFSDRGALAADLQDRMDEEGVWGWLWRTNFRYLETQPPVELEYRLVRVSAGEEAPDSIASWSVTSPWTGPGDLHLVPAAGVSN